MEILEIFEFMPTGIFVLFIISILILIPRLYDMILAINDSFKSENGFFSGLRSSTWWVYLGIISLINGYIYIKKENQIINKYNVANLKYDDYIREFNYLNSELFKSGTRCNDGWRSSSYGSGTCSHHGGIDYSISMHRYNYLSNKIYEYETIKTHEWFNFQKTDLLKTHLSAEFWIVVVLLWLYKLLKS